MYVLTEKVDLGVGYLISQWHYQGTQLVSFLGSDNFFISPCFQANCKSLQMIAKVAGILKLLRSTLPLPPLIRLLFMSHWPEFYVSILKPMTLREMGSE